MRLKNIISKYFAEISKQPNNKMQIFKCRFCNQTYAHHITRMAQHLFKSCRGCPQEIKDIVQRSVKSKHKKSHDHPRRSNAHSSDYSDSISDKELNINTNIELISTNVHNSVASDHRKNVSDKTASSNSQIRNFFDNMTPKNVTEAQKLLAKAIYASGTPLSMTENPHWRAFFSYLRPSFPLPTRRQISQKFLNDIYSQIKTEVKKKVMAAGCLGLQCDGWSNIRNEGIVNIILTTPEPIFYKSIPTGSKAETGAYIAAELITVIDEVGPFKVLGICTDNAAAMKAAWRILEDHYGPNNLVFYGCAAHTLNLLLKDIMKIPSIDELSNNVKNTVKEIKHSHVLSATFAEIQSKDQQNISTTLKLPVITRWGSLVTRLNSVLVNKHNLQALAIEQTASIKLNRLTKNQLLNEEFWFKVSKILDLVQSVACWIRSLEGDTPKLSSVPDAFAEIERHFNELLRGTALPPLTSNETTAAVAAVQSRRRMAVKPIHLAANILDPAYKGSNLSPADQITGTVQIHELAEKFGLDIEKILSELADYNANEGLWKQQYVQQAAALTCVSTWWKGICHTTALSKLAQELLKLPATPAATERSFSTHGWIHNSKRNRLHVERAAMIAYISYNMRLLDDNQVKKRTMKDVAQTSTPTPEESEESVGESEHEDEEDVFEDVEYLL